MQLSFTSTTLVLAGLLVMTCAVGVLLLKQHPPVTRESVFASLPWFVTGAALHALRRVVSYPELVVPLLRTPWVYLLIASLGGLAWTLLAQLTSTHTDRTTVFRNFGLMGVGTLLPPLVLLIVSAGVASPQSLIVWIAIPVVAVVVTYFVVLSLGLWLPNPAYFAGVAGGVIIFGTVVDGLTTALSLELGGRVASPALLALSSPVAGLQWVTASLAVVGLTIWLRLAAGIAALVVLELLERSYPVQAERGLKLATVGSLALSANTFMLALGGGWFV